ncbi:MAG: hypothetical protein KF773_27245 [Deltaproteobacteria bacterium]|nr:hypothetical protein [Deltaproteobacteria bacterium]
MRLSIAPALLLTMGAACTAKPPVVDCTDGKCDLPTDPAEVSCRKRRTDAFNPNRTSFNEPFLRWSCADVAGVTAEDRGQEYCEYFAVAKLPDAPALGAPAVLGRNLGPDSSYGTTPVAMTLTPAQIDALEARPTDVVGQCVFTSWNSDVAADTCRGAACPKIVGLDVDETFRMTFDVNSADAADKLVEDCLVLPPAGDPDDPKDLRHDDFMRGCMWNAEINETEYRKSDTTVCAAMTRAAECGCSVTTGESLGKLISPIERRGFQLGTWTGFVSGNQAATRLPANCRYVLAESQTLVACDLTADDLLYGAADVKAYCAEKYADNIVVHVPVPTTKLACDPTSSASPYAGTCSATPWVLTPGPAAAD